MSTPANTKKRTAKKKAAKAAAKGAKAAQNPTPSAKAAMVALHNMDALLKDIAPVLEKTQPATARLQLQALGANEVVLQRYLQAQIDGEQPEQHVTREDLGIAE